MADDDTPSPGTLNGSSREDDIATIRKSISDLAYRWGITPSEALNQVVGGGFRSR
jgi:hypothetical protein